MMTFNLRCSIIMVLSAPLIACQCHAAEVWLSLSPPAIQQTTEGAGLTPRQQQNKWPSLPDTLLPGTTLYPDLASDLLTQRREEAIAAIRQARDETKTSWQSLFASASSYYLIPPVMALPRDNGLEVFGNVLELQRRELALLAILPSDDKLVQDHHLHQDLFGTPYLIWPHSSGHHPTDRFISWPLSAEIAFAQETVHFAGTLTFRTDIYEAELHFSRDSQQIYLAFSAPALIDKPVIHSQARLFFSDQQFDSLVMIAQLFGDHGQHESLPLWGQFRVVAPDKTSPVSGQFSSML